MPEPKKPQSRERFLKVYYNLPLNVREEVIYVVDGSKPITWNVVYLEIRNNTKLGKEILRRLEDLEII